MVTRTSEEILRNIANLFAELSEAQEYEQKVTRDRLDELTNELYSQKQKAKDIAHILLRE